MTVRPENQSAPAPVPGGRALPRIAAALLHTVPFGLCAGPLVAFWTGWTIGYSVAVGGLLGLVAGLVVATADWLGLQRIWRRNGQAPSTEAVALPERQAALAPQPVGDLWLVLIGPPVFAGLFLCLPLLCTPGEGGRWGNIVVYLSVGAILVLWATVVGPPRLRKLARRGEWAPPGTLEHPYRVALALTALLMAAVVAATFAGVWILQLAGL
jgi:hypothetical protein